MDANGKVTDVLPPDSDVKTAPLAPRKYTLVYYNILTMLYWHIAALYGLYLCFATAKWATITFNAIVYVCAVLGITAGAHRLWSHRSYKAALPLQILLILFHSMSFQYPVFNWARDHRAHHKFCDTDADPHDARRGFFFTHVGWLLAKKHPEAIKKGKLIDVSDIYANPIVQFQRNNSYICVLLTFVLPTLIPIYCWQETLNIAYHVGLLRLVCVLNANMFTNSAAHRYGCKPYDRYMSPTQSPILSIATLGESFHNYHHVFPFDYRSAELGNNYINLTTKFIDFFAWIGWAYDLKYASDDMIAKRAERTGDGTDLWGRVKEDLDITKISKVTDDAIDRDGVAEDYEVKLTDNVWGWGDKDMTEDDMEILKSQ